MKVDLSIPDDGPLDGRDFAASAEHAGYAALWTSEVRHDPLTSLALAAIATERVELGTAIALAFARNPMSLALQANDVHQLSGGRLLLGLGSQIKAHITRRFSMPWSHPVARMREFVLAMRAIWECWNTGEKLNFRGDFYTHTLMPPFFNPGANPYGPPRVLLAGVGEAMTTAAGEVSDGFLCHGFTTERYLREVTLPALQKGRGPDLDGFEVCGLPFVATGDTEEAMEQATAAVRERVAFYGTTPAYRPVLELHGWGELSDQLHTLSVAGRWSEMGTLIDDEVLRAFAVVEEPDRVAGELLRRYGDVMTRLTLYTPYPIDPSLSARIASEVQKAVGD
jgi:probable F420-dependent oxidoreductase